MVETSSIRARLTGIRITRLFERAASSALRPYELTHKMPYLRTISITLLIRSGATLEPGGSK